MNISHKNIETAKEIISRQCFEQDDNWSFIAEALQQAEIDTQKAINNAISGNITMKDTKLLMNLNQQK